MEMEFGEHTVDSDELLIIVFWDWINNKPEIKAHPTAWQVLDQSQKEATFRSFASLALDFSPYANLTLEAEDED